MTEYKRKLIEVALPLDAINAEAAREKSIRHGHPSTLHLWWARRPLAACRAVLFASLVDDPSSRPEEFPTEEAQTAERQRLFALIEQLVKWENSNNAEILDAAKAEILKSCDGDLPPLLDPFAGGGSIPLEAQRLGLEAHASDLNPVAVLINKALIEIPPLFAGKPPVRPDLVESARLKTWQGAQGLADDVRYYGQWMREQAEQRIGHLYPKVQLPPEHGGGEATVIAWIWARTVQSPNPAWNGHVPLVRSFALSTKKGKETWVEPIVDHETQTIRYEIRSGTGEIPQGTVERSGAVCLATASPIPFEYIRAEAKAGRMGEQLMAVVAEGQRSRTYVASSTEQEAAALEGCPIDPPDTELPEKALGFRVQAYGMDHHRDLFTDRQLVALTTFSDLVSEARDRIRADALAVGLSADPTPLRDAGTGAAAYAEAVSVYLAFAVDRVVMTNSSLARWNSVGQKAQHMFGRQAVSMVWDFAECNPLGSATGAWSAAVGLCAGPLAELGNGRRAVVTQMDARHAAAKSVITCTDPPYYDNISYADLSDIFYVWLRRSLRTVYTDEFSTLLVPKEQELVATPFRFEGDSHAADRFFERGLGESFLQIHAAQDPRFPFTIYYAFKQAESTKNGTASTGWETMLQSLLDTGFGVDGTWPMRSEMATRMRSQHSNALASSIVLVCRRRDATASLATRKDFVATLRAELPGAVKLLQQGNIAPVDLAQSAIGPGMAVFSRFSKVVEADGSAMRVRSALELINQVLDEAVAGSDADFDADTRWAVTWFEDCGMNEGDFGRAEQLSKSRNTSVDGLVEAGILAKRPGKVRLLAREDLAEDWDPGSDARLTVWEVTQHLIGRLGSDGEEAAAALLRQVGSGLGGAAKELAYRLYLVCERKKWASEAIAYNGLITAWPELERLAAARDDARGAETGQGQLL